jgi:hypothetical protein
MHNTRFAQFSCLRQLYNASQNTVSTTSSHNTLFTLTMSFHPIQRLLHISSPPNPLSLPQTEPHQQSCIHTTSQITVNHTIRYHTSQPLPTSMSCPFPSHLGHAGVLADPAITHIVFTQPAAAPVPGWVAAQKHFDDGLKAVPAPPIRLLYKAWVSREMAKGKSSWRTASWSSGRMGGRWDAERAMW